MQPGPKDGKRYPPYDPVEFAKRCAEFEAAAKAGKYDCEDDAVLDLPDLLPAPGEGGDTLAVFIPAAPVEGSMPAREARRKP